ncbi:hypothetical protein DFH08DRAFT_963495 [Mycena albidolilacea]|uniref:Uncharacterized protein n=1 Tax=Mycena albidolilacea TaxID=1033008 RepID=A0AAD6ZVU2_9AGAR|nr:hypothetical protein DFH08DRAFT_963495 [Mycena albidolilacea]
MIILSLLCPSLLLCPILRAVSSSLPHLRPRLFLPFPSLPILSRPVPPLLASPPRNCAPAPIDPLRGCLPPPVPTARARAVRPRPAGAHGAWLRPGRCDAGAAHVPPPRARARDLLFPPSSFHCLVLPTSRVLRDPLPPPAPYASSLPPSLSCIGPRTLLSPPASPHPAIVLSPPYIPRRSQICSEAYEQYLSPYIPVASK